MRKINWLNILEQVLATILATAAVALIVYLFNIVTGKEEPSSLLWVTSGALLIFILLIFVWRGFREKSKAIGQWIIAQWKLIAVLVTAIFEAIAVYATAYSLEIVIVLIFSLLIFLLTRSYYLPSQKFTLTEVSSEGESNQVGSQNISPKAPLPSKLTYQILFPFIAGVTFTFIVAQFANLDLPHSDFLSNNTPTPTKSELLRVTPDKFAEIVLVIDTSDNYELPRIKNVVKTLVEKLLPNDRIGLVSYDTGEVKTILPITPIGKTGDELFLVKLNDLGSYRNGNYSLFYDAIMFSTNEIKFQRNDYKSVIIFVSGYRLQPSEANYRVEDVLISIERSAESGTMVIPISLGSKDSDLMQLIASAADTEVYASCDLFWINDLINKYLQ